MSLNVEGLTGGVLFVLTTLRVALGPITASSQPLLQAAEPPGCAASSVRGCVSCHNCVRSNLRTNLCHVTAAMLL